MATERQGVEGQHHTVTIYTQIPVSWHCNVCNASVRGIPDYITQRSVNAYVKYPVEVAARTLQTIDLTIKDGQVKHWTPLRCLTKLDLSHGGEHPQKEFQSDHGSIC